MGTRNLTVVKSGDVYKLAQYGQWDGYPNGLGVDLLDVLRATSVEKLREAVQRIVQLSDDEVKALWATVGADGRWVDMKQSDEFKKRYPSLHRDTHGAKFLDILLSTSQPVPHQSSLEFASDSLMCEWCYVIDLDEGVLDVYKGFNTQPLGEKERFVFLEAKCRTEPNQSGETYHPVKFVGSYLLDHLPTDEEFCNAVDRSDEE
jgi:hypothetical protein